MIGEGKTEYQVPCKKCGNPKSTFYNDLMDYESGKGITVFLCDTCQQSFSSSVRQWIENDRIRNMA